MTRQINTHDTTSKVIKRVEADIIRQGVRDVDNTFTEKSGLVFKKFIFVSACVVALPFAADVCMSCI